MINKKEESLFSGSIINDFRFEVETLKTVLELSLTIPKDLLKNTLEFNELIKDLILNSFKIGKVKSEKDKKVIGFLQGLILFYFNSAWGIGKGLVRKCLIDSLKKKVKVVLIGRRRVEFKIGEYDKGTQELFSLAKKILWEKEVAKEGHLNLRDLNEVKKVFHERCDSLKQTQKQLLKISQDPSSIIKILKSLNENMLPIFIFFSCLPEKKIEELLKYVSNHLPSSYEDALPDGRKVPIAEYFLQKSTNISEYFEKIRVLLYLYGQNKHKVIEEIVRIKTRDFLSNLFSKEEGARDLVIKTILDTVETQFNPRIQLMGLFIRII